MTVLLPDPYPGELLFGVLTRYRLRMGITNYQMMQEVFQGRLNTLNRRLPVQLSILVDSLPSWQNYTVEELAKNHSLLRYYTAFQLNDRAASILKRMHGTGVGLPAFMGINMSEISEKTHLMLCLDCVATDTAKYGEPYWHVVHQAPGVWCCPHHPDTLLSKTSAKTSSKSTTASMATPLEVVIDAGASIPISNLTNQDRRILQYISNAALFLLREDHHPRDDSWAIKKYKEKLADLNCLLPRTSINRVKLKLLISDSFTEDFIRLLGYKNPQNFAKVLTNALLQTDHGVHTIHHLLLMYILSIDIEKFFTEKPGDLYFIHAYGDGPWECKNPMQNLKCGRSIEKFEYRRSSQFLFRCPACGFAYVKTRSSKNIRVSVYDYGHVWYSELKSLLDSTELPKSKIAKLMGVSATTLIKLANNLDSKIWKNPPHMQVIIDRAARKIERKLELRTIHRQNLIQAIRANPNILRSDTSNEEFHKASDWLRRMDREWFNENAPIKRSRKRPHASSHGDWPKIDESAAIGVFNLKQSLLQKDKEQNSLIRITKKALSTHFTPHIASLYGGYMPLTRRALDASSESIFDFRIRRLHYVALNLKNENKYLTFTGFLRLSKIYKTRQSEEMHNLAREIYEAYIADMASNAENYIL